MSLGTNANAEDVANCYIQNVFKLHGMPKSLVSDRDTKFTGHFWTALFKAIGTSLDMSTAFHPESDGQTERSNSTIEDYLRHFVNARQDDWVQCLPLAEFAFNSQVNAATGLSPFELDLGYVPPTPFSSLIPTTDTPATDSFLDHQAATLQMAHDKMIIAQDRAKAHYDSKHRTMPLSVGDQVYLDTKDLALKHSGRPNKRKLGPKRIGPYKITRVASNGRAAQIDIPSKLRIHPVFHINRLSPYVAPPEGDTRAPPDVLLDDGTPGFIVEAIVGSRRVDRKREYLIKWMGYPTSENSWQSASDCFQIRDMCQQFDAAQKKAKAASKV